MGKLEREHPDREGQRKGNDELSCLITGIQATVVYLHGGEVSCEAIPLGGKLGNFFGGLFEACREVGGLGRCCGKRDQRAFVGLSGGVEVRAQKRNGVSHVHYRLTLLRG